MSWANLLKNSKETFENRVEHISMKNQMEKPMETLLKSIHIHPNQNIMQKDNQIKKMNYSKLPIFQYIQHCHFSRTFHQFSRYQYQQLRLLYKKLIIPHCSKHNIMNIKFEDFLYFAKNYKNLNIYGFKNIKSISIIDSYNLSNLTDKQINHLDDIIDPYEKADIIIKFLQINGNLQSDELEKLGNSSQINIELISELKEIDIQYDLQNIVLQIHDIFKNTEIFETLHTGQLFTFLHKSK